MSNLKSEPISYTVIRSARKTIEISLKFNGDTIVRVPLGCTQKYIHDFVTQKKEWIESKRKKITQHQPKEDISANDYIHIRGIAYKKIFQKGLHNHVSFDNDMIIVTHTALLGNVFLEEYFKKQAIKYLTERFSVIAEQAKMLRLITDKPVQFRALRRRWGSCDSGGVITLAFQLFIMSDILIDYVIKHEFCHLKEMNHSPAFYKLLAQLDPYHTVHRQSLKYCHYYT